jgi:hypothetical protein
MEGDSEGATEGAAALGAAALGDPAVDAHAATSSGMISIEYRIRIAMVLLFRLDAHAGT